MQRPDLPVAADPSGELGGVSLAGGQHGDRVDGYGLHFPPDIRRMRQMARVAYGKAA